jgi:hypothetical protein
MRLPSDDKAPTDKSLGKSVSDAPADSQQRNRDGADTGKPSSTDAEELHWMVEVTPATDPQGWRYSSQFSDLEQIRAGGRATRRGTGAALHGVSGCFLHSLVFEESAYLWCSQICRCRS